MNMKGKIQIFTGEGKGKTTAAILDEVNVAVYMGLIAPSELLEFLDSQPEILELILTGRYALPEVMIRADEVYEAKNIKHPFDIGVAAKEGIEY